MQTGEFTWHMPGIRTSGLEERGSLGFMGTICYLQILYIIPGVAASSPAFFLNMGPGCQTQVFRLGQQTFLPAQPYHWSFLEF